MIVMISGLSSTTMMVFLLSMLSPSSARRFVYTVGYRALFPIAKLHGGRNGNSRGQIFTNHVTKKALWVESLTSSSNDVNLESRTYSSCSIRDLHCASSLA